MDTARDDSSALGEPTDWHKAEAAACEAENELLRCEILQVEAQLEVLGEEPEEPNDALKRVAALELELAGVEASLNILRSSQPSLPTSELRVEERARVDVVDTVEELEKAIAWEEQRREDEEGALERDKLYLQDATTLYATLAARASSAEDSFSPRAAGDALVLRTQGLVHQLSRRTEALQRALVEFVDQLALGDPARRAAEAGDKHEQEQEGASEWEGKEGAEGREGEGEGPCEGGRATKRRRLSEKSPSSSSAPFNLGEWIRADPLLDGAGAAVAQSDGEKDGAEAGIVEPEKVHETRSFQVKKLLEALLNRSVLLHSDPWLDMSPSSSSASAPAPGGAPNSDGGTGSYPPELVAFLVRAGIVVQHPVERAKVRLEDFAGLGL